MRLALSSLCSWRRERTSTQIKTAVAKASQRKRISALTTTKARAASHWVKA